MFLLHLINPIFLFYVGELLSFVFAFLGAHSVLHFFFFVSMCCFVFFFFGGISVGPFRRI